MEVEEAIYTLERHAHTEAKWPGTEEVLEALDMAVNALSAAGNDVVGNNNHVPTCRIDREAWGDCAYCSGIPHMEGAELKPCASGNIGCEVTFGKCRDDEVVGMVVYHRNAAAGYVEFDFCPFCGKPQTEAAWAELERRLRG